MLLDVPDAPRSDSADGIPSGDTEMEIKVPPELANPPGDKPEEKPPEKAADTASAAKAILEKYARRNRR
jgi:hypothetical protein